MRSWQQLREDAWAIWRAGVAAVDSRRLVRETVSVESGILRIGDQQFPLRDVGRIRVVGAGKAGAGMAAGLLDALGETVCREKQLDGWINVPDDCVQALPLVTLHAARPAGVNEPTPRGAAGADEILRRVGTLRPEDLCLCLLSGGGSALLPAPVPGVPLEEKLALTRHLSAAGANIQQLNSVRKQLSRIKGGGLARHCTAGHLISLIISDVLGDPLDVIASGPTVPDSSTPQEALDILRRFSAESVAPQALAYLQQRTREPQRPPAPRCRVRNLVIGNNAVAVDAAGIEAERRGYSHAMVAADRLEGPAEDVGRRLAELACSMSEQAGPDCLISGGEPTVHLAPATRRGKGGRNQQLVLAALEHCQKTRGGAGNPCSGLLILSGGTDGEDGPTDAAGAWIDEGVAAAAQARQLQPADYLPRNDAYHFFAPLDSLLKTGPTHTNVCDVRVVLVAREQARNQKGVVT